MVSPFKNHALAVEFDSYVDKAINQELQHGALQGPFDDGISNKAYLGTDFELYYPSIDSIIRTLNSLGPGASIFKFDISHAFRDIPIDLGILICWDSDIDISSIWI